MYNSRISIGSKARHNNPFKVSLGNGATRYNSEVTVQRKKYLISSTKNSEDVPEWMNRTQFYHQRENNRNRSFFSNVNSSFKPVEQTYVYAGLTKPVNPQSNFDRLVKPRQRNKWEMKNQTFQLQWPRPQAEIKKEREIKIRSQMSMHESSTAGFRPNQTMRSQLSKYAYFESPLHVQKQTPIKIGHPYLLNSTYIK